jgi:acyl-homoserine lactone acylase PvdQ
MICDLSEDGIYTALPGGIDGSRFAPTYASWLQEWLVGSYHKLAPPEENERTVRLRS